MNAFFKKKNAPHTVYSIAKRNNSIDVPSFYKAKEKIGEIFANKSKGNRFRCDTGC